MFHCVGGHLVCVQKFILGKTHPRGGEARKINIAADSRLKGECRTKKIKNVRFGTVL
jgi:hypothetical protein